jgi:hypothetical protein
VCEAAAAAAAVKKKVSHTFNSPNQIANCFEHYNKTERNYL